MRGEACGALWILRRILPWVTSLLSMTPLSTRESSTSPPGIFSTLAYRLMSISLRPPSSMCTVFTASSARLTISSEKREMNLVPVQLCTSSVSFAVSLRSSGMDISVSVCVIVSKAFRYLVRRGGGYSCGGAGRGHGAYARGLVRVG